MEFRFEEEKSSGYCLMGNNPAFINQSDNINYNITTNYNQELTNNNNNNKNEAHTSTATTDECLEENEGNLEQQQEQITESTTTVESTWKAQQYPDADSLIKSETKQLIFNKVSEEITLKELNKKRLEIGQQIQLLKTKKSEKLEKNEDLLMTVELEKHQINHLEKVMQNTGEIIAKLNENIEKLQQSFKESKLISLKEKVEKLSEKYSIRVNYFHKQINLKNEEINLLKNCLENADDSFDDLELKQRNLLLKAQIQEANQKLENLKSEENNKKAEAKKQQEELLSEKNQLGETLENSKVRLENFKDLVKNNEKENTVKVKEAQHRKMERLVFLNGLKEKKIQLNQYIGELMQITNSTENSNRNLENECEKLENERKELEVIFEEKNQIFAETTKQSKTKIEELSLNLLNSENELLVIVEEKRKLNNDLDMLKADYLNKSQENNNCLVQNLVLENDLEKNRAFLDKAKAENVKNKEQLNNLQKTIEIIEEKIQIKDDEILKENSNAQELSMNSQQSYEKFCREHSSRLEDMTKKKAYAMTSSNYFDEQLNKLQEEVDDKGSDIATILKEVSVLTEDNNVKKLLVEKYKKQINQLKFDNQISSSSAAATISSSRNNIFIKELKESEDNTLQVSSILKSPSGISNNNKIPPIKKVHFIDITSQATTESDSFPEDIVSQESNKGSTMDDLMNKIKLRCSTNTDASAGSSRNDN